MATQTVPARSTATATTDTMAMATTNIVLDCVECDEVVVYDVEILVSVSVLGRHPSVLTASGAGAQICSSACASICASSFMARYIYAH